MRNTSNYGWPVAEVSDARRDYPATVDGPRSDAIDAELARIETAMAAMVAMENGTALAAPSVMTTVANYANVYGESSWVNPATGILTVPVDGVYRVTTRTRVAPPSATYNFGNTLRSVPDTPQVANWLMNYPQGFGAAQWGCELVQRFTAGTQLYVAVYGTAYSGNATIDRGSFSAQLILPD